ncbi:hypothetical protein M2401_001126 [Pseudomonas sp. JUb42]|nr:hypothetical protein [Pseudomonas sp. JUb42]
MTLIAFAAWLVGALGFGLLIGGVALIHVPTACITAGICLLGWAFLADRASARLQHRPKPGGG